MRRDLRRDIPSNSLVTGGAHVVVTVATGCALTNIPLLIISEEEFQSLKNNMKIAIDTESSTPITFLE